MSTAILRPLLSPSRATVHPAPSWLERLAAWAERQPAHRRLGSWTAWGHLPPARNTLPE
jgi:hypothetical protein